MQKESAQIKKSLNAYKGKNPGGLYPEAKEPVKNTSRKPGKAKLDYKRLWNEDDKSKDAKKPDIDQEMKKSRTAAATAIAELITNKTERIRGAKK